MPHHLKAIDGDALPWDDFPSFLSHVYRECRRLKAIPPTVEQLEGEYVQRCVSRAMNEARREVKALREQRERHRGGR